MKCKSHLTVFLLVVTTQLFSKELTQKIKGIVIDKDSRRLLPVLDEVTSFTDALRYDYDPDTHQWQYNKLSGFVPVISYQFNF